MGQDHVPQRVLIPIRHGANLDELRGGSHAGEGVEERSHAMPDRWTALDESAMNAVPPLSGGDPSPGGSVGEVERVDGGATDRGPPTQDCG